MKQSFKDFAKELREVEAKRAQDKQAMEAKQDRYKEATEAKLKEFEAKLDKLSTPSTQQQQASTPPASGTEMPKASNVHLYKP